MTRLVEVHIEQLIIQMGQLRRDFEKGSKDLEKLSQNMIEHNPDDWGCCPFIAKPSIEI